MIPAPWFASTTKLREDVSDCGKFTDNVYYALLVAHGEVSRKDDEDGEIEVNLSFFLVLRKYRGYYQRIGYLEQERTADFGGYKHVFESVNITLI